jgi:uncharacterized membrane protein SirB2
MYATLKLIHVTCVVISILGFFLRGILAQRDAAVMRRRWIRVLPHFNDVALLASAVAMAVLSGQYPFSADWLTAKLLGLIVYVGLGVVALRSGHPGRRRLAFVMALVVFGWMVSVALTRHPAGFLVLLA